MINVNWRIQHREEVEVESLKYEQLFHLRSTPTCSNGCCATDRAWAYLGRPLGFLSLRAFVEYIAQQYGR